jgi:hypothetical protein
MINFKYIKTSKIKFLIFIFTAFTALNAEIKVRQMRHIYSGIAYVKDN